MDIEVVQEHFLRYDLKGTISIDDGDEFLTPKYLNYTKFFIPVYLHLALTHLGYATIKHKFEFGYDSHTKSLLKKINLSGCYLNPSQTGIVSVGAINGFSHFLATKEFDLEKMVGKVKKQMYKERDTTLNEKKGAVCSDDFVKGLVSEMFPLRTYEHPSLPVTTTIFNP